MPGRAGVPFERMAIFPSGALLQVNLTCLVKNEDVNGAMTQVIPMHFRTAGVTPDPIIFVDDWQRLVLRRARLDSRDWREGVRQSDPLQQRYFLCSRVGVELQIARERIPFIAVFP